MSPTSPTALVRHVFEMRTSIMRWRDSEGRPLHEGRSPPDVWPADMSRVRCKYQDARAQSALPMNVSALVSVSRDMPFVHAALGALRSELFGLEPGEPASILQMSQVVATGWSLPYWSCFAATALGGQPPALSPQVASLFKVSIGLSWLTRRLLKLVPAERHARTLVSASDLLVHVDRTGALIGTHEVCAAPLEMVGVVLESLVNGPRAPVASAAAIAPDLAAARAFAKAQHNVIYWRSACVERLKALTPELMAQAEQSPLPTWLPWWLRSGLQREPFDLSWDGSDPARLDAKTRFVHRPRDRVAVDRIRAHAGLKPGVARDVVATMKCADRQFSRAGGELQRCLVASKASRA